MRWPWPKVASAQSAQLVGKAATRKRRMDSLWAEMNDGDGGRTAGAGASASAGASTSAGAPGTTAAAAPPAANVDKARRKKRKRDALLASLLGGGGGGGAAGGALSFKAKKKKKGVVEFKVPAPALPARKPGTRGVGAGAGAVADVVKSAKVSVTQTVKYAGSAVSVTQTFQAGTKAANDARRAAAAREKAERSDGIDGALAAISRPSAVSTVKKSSVDWDAFKEESQLGEELEQATKDGYLQRQDLLNRCDVRQFEREKAQRSLERAKRDK